MREPAGFEQLGFKPVIEIYWTDRKPDVPFDFTVVVSVRDLAGNVTMSPPLRITDAGRE